MLQRLGLASDGWNATGQQEKNRQRSANGHKDASRRIELSHLTTNGVVNVVQRVCEKAGPFPKCLLQLTHTRDISGTVVGVTNRERWTRAPTEAGAHRRLP
jgi:hypothetical protein